MDTESQRIYDRMSLHRLMKKHLTWSPAQLAEEMGRSERWARKWVRRLCETKTSDFRMYNSQSRALKSRQRQTG